MPFRSSSLTTEVLNGLQKIPSYFNQISEFFFLPNTFWLTFQNGLRIIFFLIWSKLLAKYAYEMSEITPSTIYDTLPLFQ